MKLQAIAYGESFNVPQGVCFQAHGFEMRGVGPCLMVQRIGLSAIATPAPLRLCHKDGAWRIAQGKITASDTVALVTALNEALWESVQALPSLTEIEHHFWSHANDASYLSLLEVRMLMLWLGSLQVDFTRLSTKLHGVTAKSCDLAGGACGLTLSCPDPRHLLYMRVEKGKLTLEEGTILVRCVNPMIQVLCSLSPELRRKYPVAASRDIPNYSVLPTPGQAILFERWLAKQRVSFPKRDSYWGDFRYFVRGSQLVLQHQVSDYNLYSVVLECAQKRWSFVSCDMPAYGLLMLLQVMDLMSDAEYDRGKRPQPRVKKRLIVQHAVHRDLSLGWLARCLRALLLPQLRDALFFRWIKMLIPERETRRTSRAIVCYLVSTWKFLAL